MTLEYRPLLQVQRDLWRWHCTTSATTLRQSHGVALA